MLKNSNISNAAGRRSKEIIVQVATDGIANSMGEVRPVFLTSYSRFAEIVGTAGREFIAAMTVQPMLKFIVKLPYDSYTKNINPRDRILDGTVVYNISEVMNERMSNEKMVLWCVGEQ
jgi:head-tail adaptor